MDADGDNLTIKNNEAAGQFEIRFGSEVALLAYERRGNAIVFTHTEVPLDLEGQGIASRLARAGLDYARTHQLTVIPLCPFVRNYIQQHPDYLEIVDPQYRD